jgi:hypothetical protein
MGYDLLCSMGVTEALAVMEGLHFDVGKWNHDTISPALTPEWHTVFEAPLERQEEFSWSPDMEPSNLKAGYT